MAGRRLPGGLSVLRGRRVCPGGGRGRVGFLDQGAGAGGAPGSAQWPLKVVRVDGVGLARHLPAAGALLAGVVVDPAAVHAQRPGLLRRRHVSLPGRM
ncbi:hypothetical protein [Streptomyces viridosporus]|uniref:hypothetical protein n=1 Tax=Streptomyces viridosporus TaxID=67581 RepID=UPI00331D90DE